MHILITDFGSAKQVILIYTYNLVGFSAMKPCVIVMKRLKSRLAY